jgi:hypothetical protein
MARRLTALFLLMLAASALAGCSKCDFAWPGTPRSCHSDVPVQ